MKTIMRKKIDFGKIAYDGIRNANAVDVTIELRECGGEPTFTMKDGKRNYTGKYTPTYVELAICGNIWNGRHTDIVCGGQCLDEIAKYIHSKKFRQIYAIWKRWHLNGMHSGSPVQEGAVKRYMEAHGGKYDYDGVCEYLKEIGLYQVFYSGKSVGREYYHEPYRYGTAWLVYDLPEYVIKYLERV